MRKAIYSCLGALTVLAGTAHAEDVQGLRPGDLVAVCGDSITEQRRYSLFIEEYLLMCQPEADLSAMQMGWNGETAPGFLKRMDNDALTFRPQVATTCFGMNDSGLEPITPEKVELYRKSMDGVVKGLRQGGVRWVVVGTPGTVDTTTYTKSDVKIRAGNLAILSKVAREVADANGAGFADVNSVMTEVMTKAKAKYGAAYHVAGIDGVHPERNGHVIMAYAFLKGLKCSGDIGTITYDAKTEEASATSGHKVLSAGQGRIAVESSRYPFCFYGKPEDVTGTRGLLEFLPFNEELNRYLLVVKNAPAEKMSVRWGNETKVFTADELAKGVNLPASFGETPFQEAFLKVEQAVAQQQSFEVLAVKSLMHSLIGWKEQFPDQLVRFDEQSAMLVKRCAEMREKSRAAVVPVRHEIVIQPAS